MINTSAGVVIATLIVALATFALAIVMYKSIAFTRKQLAIMQRQTLLTEQNPLLVAESVSFSGNKIKVRIKNVGEGKAFQLSITTRLAYHDAVVTGKDKTTGEELVRFRFNPAPVLDTSEGKGDYLILKRAFTSVSNALERVVVMNKGEELEFSIEPRFQLAHTRKNILGKFVPVEGWTMATPAELKAKLEKLKKRYVSVSFFLDYKNKIGDVQYGTELSYFVFDAFGHKTMEDAFKSKFGTEYTQITNYELAFPAMDAPTYYSKTMHNYNPYETEDKENLEY